MNCCLVAQSCSTLCDPADCSPPGSSVHEDSPGKNNGAGHHPLLQGISPPGDWTWVSCIGRQLSYHWAVREVMQEHDLSWRDGAHFSQVWGKRFWSNRTACFHVLRALVWYKSGNFWSPPAFLLADILLLWSPPEMPLEGVHSYSFSLIILLFYLLYSKTQASPGSRHVPMSSEAGRGSCGVGAAGPFRVCVAEAGDVGLTSGTLRLRGCLPAAASGRLQLPSGFADGNLDTGCKD